MVRACAASGPEVVSSRLIEGRDTFEGFGEVSLFPTNEGAGRARLLVRDYKVRLHSAA